MEVEEGCSSEVLLQPFLKPWDPGALPGPPHRGRERSYPSSALLLSRGEDLSVTGDDKRQSSPICCGGTVSQPHPAGRRGWSSGRQALGQDHQPGALG